VCVSVFSGGAERNAVSASPVHSISADIRDIFPVSPEAPINTNIEAVGLYAFLNSKQDGLELYIPIALALGKNPFVRWFGGARACPREDECFISCS
jgi:hypothetical protein